MEIIDTEQFKLFVEEDMEDNDEFPGEEEMLRDISVGLLEYAEFQRGKRILRTECIDNAVEGDLPNPGDGEDEDLVGLLAADFTGMEVLDIPYYRTVIDSAYLLVQTGEGASWKYKSQNTKGQTFWDASDESDKRCNVDPATQTIVKN